MKYSYSNCSGLCCGLILDYNLCEKIWQYKCVHDKAYFSVLFGSEYIVNGYHIGLWKWQFFWWSKNVVGLLWHSSIWNFLMKNKEKNQAHEELRCPTYTTFNLHGLYSFIDRNECFMLSWTFHFFEIRGFIISGMIYLNLYNFKLSVTSAVRGGEPCVRAQLACKSKSNKNHTHAC